MKKKHILIGAVAVLLIAVALSSSPEEEAVVPNDSPVVDNAPEEAVKPSAYTFEELVELMKNNEHTELYGEEIIVTGKVATDTSKNSLGVAMTTKDRSYTVQFTMKDRSQFEKDLKKGDTVEITGTVKEQTEFQMFLKECHVEGAE